MIKIYILFLFVIGVLMSCASQVQSNEFIWPGGKPIAVSLSYDDALNNQLDNAIPALNAHNLKASFYVLLNSPAMYERLEDWRAVAKRGHELGNHSVYHPYSA